MVSGFGDLGGGFCWAGLVPSLVDCQIHNLSTSVEFSQIGIWIWGFGGGVLLGWTSYFTSFFNFFNFLLSFGMFNNISMFPHSGKKSYQLQVMSYWKTRLDWRLSIAS